MGVLDHLMNSPWASPAARSGVVAPPASARSVSGIPRVPRHGRDFTAAKSDRLVASWGTTETTLNQLLTRQLRAMRARSQQFCRDNPYGKRFLRMTQVNIVGHDGFSLAYHCLRPDGTIDKLDSATVLRAWNRWEKRGQCDVTGRASFNTLTKQIAAAVARDGEVLVRKVTGKARGLHRFQLQLLPAYLLNENHNADLAGGHKIRMGIEIDGFGKVLAYHLALGDLGNIHSIGQSTVATRIPAEEIYHLYLEEEPGQLRGLPWTVTILRQGRQLESFDESALVAAGVGAAKMGFFQSPDGEAAAIADGQDAATGDFLTDAEPGSFHALPPGWSFEAFNPNYPEANYTPFVQAQLRRMASGLDSSYAGLSADRSTENMSSIRTGSLDEREVFKLLQGWLIENFLEIVSTDWLSNALLYDIELQPLPQSKFDKFNAPVWQGRRWDWIDPKSDGDAAAVAVALRVKSRAQIIRERGDNPDVVWNELKIEDDMGFAAPHLGGGGPAPAPATNGGSNDQTANA